MISLQNINPNVWLAVGFLGQSCFFLRFFIQWLVSERKKKSTIPIIFWYLSLLGAFFVMIYAIHRRDPVFIVGQGVGLLVYTRNLIFIYSRKNKAQNDI